MGLRMLREDAKFAELKPAFSILDSADAAGIVSEIIKTTDKQEIRRAVSRISLWKNELKSPAVALQTAEDDNARVYAKIYDRYDATLRAYQAVDFDDLIRLPPNCWIRTLSCAKMAEPAAPHSGRRISGHQYCAVPAAAKLTGCAQRSPQWAMTTRRFTAGAAPRPTT